MNVPYQIDYTAGSAVQAPLDHTIAWERLKRDYEASAYPLLHLPEKVDDLDHLNEVAAYIRENAKGLLVLGTGGSSLGAKTLTALSNNHFPIHYLENVDPHTLENWLTHPDLGDYHVLLVSKSGGTVETLSQSLVLLEVLEETCGRDHIASHVHTITMPGDRPLRQLAEAYDIPVLDHDPGVGGRFSVLSNVGLLPAAVAGLDIKKIRAGAQAALQSTLVSSESDVMRGAAWQVALMQSCPQSVYMPYCDRLGHFASWIQQLWAESLGKNGKGSTPIRAVGATDQHSQLQLYLDGPKDKSFTFFTLAQEGEGAKIHSGNIDSLAYLNGHAIGTVMQSLQFGTIETIKAHGLPMRQFLLADIREQTIGALLMHFMLETIAAGYVLNVNPFDQPAVEEGKQRARDYLAQATKQSAA